MWDRHSLKTRPSLVKPTCNASPKTKDSRVVKPENWVSKLNIHRIHKNWGQKTMSELTKTSCIETTAKKKS